MLKHTTHGKLFLVQTLGMSSEQYDLFQTNPEEVDPELKSFFEISGPPSLDATIGAVLTNSTIQTTGEVLPMEKIMSAVKLAENIRAYGHLAADIYPLKDTPLDTKLIEIETYGLTEGDLRKIPAEFICPASTENAKDGYEAVEYLKQLYTTTLALNFIM